jgi:hypothetical protein
VIATAKHKCDWRKKPDIPLREWIARQRERRTPVIYVELLCEAIPVWRPVAATREAPGIYRLPAKKPDDEIWAFPPGSRVRVERRLLDGVEHRLLDHGSRLVACGLAD